MDSDFTVIDETILLECSKVRLITKEHTGILKLVRIKEDYSVYWEDDSGNEIEIHLPEIVQLIPDTSSSTLLILTKTSGTFLFHFLNDDPLKFVSEFRPFMKSGNVNSIIIQSSSQQAKSSLGEDPGFTILSSFAKVKQAYFGAASKLLGLETSKSRPKRNIASPPPRNPWLVDRSIDLPSPLRLKSPISMLIWNSFHEADGKITQVTALKELIHQSGCTNEVRPDIWRYLFGLRTGSMSSEDYSSHLEELQGEFQRLVELVEISDISDEIRTRIGTSHYMLHMYPS